MIPTLKRFLLTGAFGFAIVSLIVFATVAFAEKWMYAHLGLIGSYLVWTTLFVVMGGALFGSLVVGTWRLPKFFILFGFAFFAYACGWTAAYFSVRGPSGEWLGSLLGSLLMGLVLSLGFGVTRSTLPLSAILFGTNSVGYFVGSRLYYSLGGRTGMLLWGLTYGLCLGAGLGAVLYLAQTKRRVL